MSVQLARKWRSKNFDEIVGQELAVRLLKNSLFKHYFLPVYLFSGLRGSGKTSLARIFASAVNCALLDQFSKDPKIIVPCARCASCLAAFMGKHPDIIELDAASHTGVDNMRAVLESASFLPSMGRKRIFIIDEAHMLSRAAFNACLKLFEEPPAHVLFILATTDPEKIIDTIMSRSFQIFFDPIPVTQLVAHLEQVCRAESIPYDLAGLSVIAENSQGSARDAITSLERIALATGSASGPDVRKTLGVVSSEAVEKLFIAIAERSTHEAVAWVHQHMPVNITPVAIWRALTTMVHDAVLRLYEIPTSVTYSAEWHEKVGVCTVVQLTRWLAQACQAENAVTKSAAGREALVSLLVQMCNPGTPPTQALSTVASAPEERAASYEQQAWQRIVQQLLEQITEPMVRTLFTESRFKEIDPVTYTCYIQFLKGHELFSEWVDKLNGRITVLAQAAWPRVTGVKAEFTLAKSATTRQPTRQQPAQQVQQVRRAPLAQPAQEKRSYSDTVNQALKLFPGTISEL